MADVPKYTMFQALRPHFNVIVKYVFIDIHGFRDDYKIILHNILRMGLWILVIIYNIQYLICVIQSRHNIDEMVDTLFLFLSTVNALVKQFAFNVRQKRIKRLFTVTEDELFSPKLHEHVEILDRNEKAMERLLFYYHRMVFCCCLLQVVYPILSRFLGQEVELNAYFPFSTNKSPIFEFAVIYLAGMLKFQGYVNLLSDCIIAAFYAQTSVQLRILRYDLEHLVTADDFNNSLRHNNEDNQLQRVTIEDCKIKKKIVHCVHHYQLIIWFIKEVESVTYEALAWQFLTMAWIICMTVYKIASLSLLSTGFWTVASYLVCMLYQLFIYSYYGTQLEVESQLVSQSVYCGNWLALSPAMRRLLLIFMTRISRPIKLFAAEIVPVSLQSFVTILRASYTLFTILDKK